MFHRLHLIILHSTPKEFSYTNFSLRIQLPDKNYKNFWLQAAGFCQNNFSLPKQIPVVYMCFIFYSMQHIFALPGWCHACIWKNKMVSHLGLVFKWEDGEHQYVRERLQKKGMSLFTSRCLYISVPPYYKNTSLSTGENSILTIIINCSITKLKLKSKPR